MPELTISEAGSVQFPMVAHAAGIGWMPIPPEVAKQKRGGEAGMLLRDELEAKLARFNPWMSAEAIRQVVETLEVDAGFFEPPLGALLPVAIEPDARGFLEQRAALLGAIGEQQVDHFGFDDHSGVAPEAGSGNGRRRSY